MPCGGRIDTVRLDPAATARTGIGVAAYGEFERVFGSRITARWPMHRVADGLDQIEVLLDPTPPCLIIHPRCTASEDGLPQLLAGQARGRMAQRACADQSPHEDVMDALRGGIRDRFPEGRIEQPKLKWVHV